MLADDQKVELEGTEGILVYRDSSDSNIYYYCSTRPGIARDGGAYRLTLVAYDKPQGGRAGMLSFVVDLELEEEQMQKLRAALPGANLRPMPWTSGTVAAAVIGGSPALGTPSLLGSNSAALSIDLTTDQYILLQKSTGSGQAPPILIVYNLSYEAFRPEYEFRIEFDENKFRNWIQKKCSANLLFISVEKVETFEELKQNGVIRVVAVNETGDDPPEGFRRAFLRSLQSVLTPLPRFAPPPEGGASSWSIGFDCSAVQDIQNLSRRLDCNMQISGPVTRSVYLQGALFGLDAALAANPPVILPTSGQFVQSVVARCSAELDGHPLETVNVDIYKQGEPRPRVSRVFNNGKGSEWPLELTHSPGTDSDFAYRCGLYFQDRAETATSGLIGIRREQAFLDIVPEEFYTYRRYSIQAASDFPWSLMRSVDVALRGPSQLAITPAALTLGGATTVGAITAFATTCVSLADVSVLATYRPNSGAAFSIETLAAGPTILLNPFRARRVIFQAAANIDWERYDSIQIAVGPADTGQLWASASKLTLRRASQKAEFRYWYAFGKTLKCQTTFQKDNRPTAKKTFEVTGTIVTISGPEQAAAQER